MIALVVGSRSGIQTNNYPGRYQHQELVVGRDWGAEVSTQDFTSGGIIIDTFDRASAQKKWMGRSESEITQRDRMNLRPVVREQVRTILKRFPPSISKR